MASSAMRNRVRVGRFYTVRGLSNDKASAANKSSDKPNGAGPAMGSRGNRKRESVGDIKGCGCRIPPRPTIGGVSSGDLFSALAHQPRLNMTPPACEVGEGPCQGISVSALAGVFSDRSRN